MVSDDPICATCDMCSRAMNNHEHSWLRIKNHWGYNSSKDLQLHECVLCEPCWDKVRAFIESSGGRVRVSEYDIATGAVVGPWPRK